MLAGGVIAEKTLEKVFCKCLRGGCHSAALVVALQKEEFNVAKGPVFPAFL